MIAREIIISALREWMAELGKRSSVAVSDWESETTAQMVALARCCGVRTFGLSTPVLHFFFVAAVLTLWSMLHI
ncbi:hypothetical protein DMI62_20005 [Escherichia coli]|nr:hypothetical protein [Escherichia coli]